MTLCSWPNVNTGNNMITIAIWCKKPRVNSSKTIKLHESIGLEQFVDFKELTDAYLFIHPLINVCEINPFTEKKARVQTL